MYKETSTKTPKLKLEGSTLLWTDIGEQAQGPQCHCGQGGGWAQQVREDWIGWMEYH